MEPDRQDAAAVSERRRNWPLIISLGALALLVLMLVYVAATKNGNQDKLINPQTTTEATSSNEKLCSSNSTFHLIKRDLFHRASQIRSEDQAVFDSVAGYAVLRMENPVMESEDSQTGTVNCSGSLSIDLPPGVAVQGGKRTLSADVDYAIQPAASGRGASVELHNIDAIVGPLATLRRIEETSVEDRSDTTGPEAGAETAPPASTVPVQPQSPTRLAPDCSTARSRGEAAVCADSGLSALDRNMTQQYRRAMAVASPDQQVQLKSSRDRFLAYRDRCPDSRCIGDAYVGRMREIRDIMEGRWQPPR